MSELVFEEKHGRVVFALIRRTNAGTKDGKYTIGKITPSYRRADPNSWRLHLNGDEAVTLEELSQIYLVMAEMTARTSETAPTLGQ